MKYGAYWCVVHNSECDHHNLFLAHSIFLLFFSSFNPLLHASIASISLTHSAPLTSQFCISFSPSDFPFTQSFFLSFPSSCLHLLSFSGHLVLPLVCPALTNAIYCPFLLVPGQRRPTRPFQQQYRCMMSWWRPGPCGVTTWRTFLSRTASSIWESLPSPATSTPAATKTRASLANT